MKANKTNQITIFHYLDYRQFLNDLTQELKKKRELNLRHFAQVAGIKSPGYLKMVIDGTRNLSIETAEKFCLALGLQGKQKTYFEKLVLYHQTQDPNLKKIYFEDLMSLSPRSPEFALQKQTNHYWSHLYYACIREMVTLKDFEDNHKKIASRLCPPISPLEAKKALQTLLKLGLLTREGGQLKQTKKLLQTEGRNTQVVESYHFHEEALDKARRALGYFSQKERYFHALTLSLPKEMSEEIINDFYFFRNQLIEKIEKNKKPADEVYQINFQFFPLTKKRSMP